MPVCRDFSGSSSPMQYANGKRGGDSYAQTKHCRESNFFSYNFQIFVKKLWYFKEPFMVLAHFLLQIIVIQKNYAPKKSVYYQLLCF